MATRTIDAASLLDDVAVHLEHRDDLPATAQKLAEDLDVEREEVEAVLLVLAADGRVELDDQDGGMAVIAAAPPVEAEPDLPVSLATLEKVDAVVTTLEAAGSRMRRILRWAPFVGMAAGAAAGAMLSAHDRPLTALCAGVAGGIVGYLLKDTLGPRTWWDTV
ncbi:hypothetical protein Mal4_16610 [Maioricimonas rarisocia]|uniref:Uncharacterized protein n=1 Tax=Maioricimonas rarisocia TaxID=2528026 RepID=A0A517Z4D9_9PLAN|nr:hypothetical protein [Maioricimonas rarisocia]QDU37350.1 hypothetical protein Mal4_16610 [Maioricimonas rarisocia]